MAKREVIYPAGKGPGGILSPCIRYGNLVFTAGMVGSDPETGEIPDSIEEQSRNTMENLKAALEAAGTSMDMVLKASCFVADLNDRPKFNEVYITYFSGEPPVRTCVQAGSLGPGILIEVDVVAGVPE